MLEKQQQGDTFDWRLVMSKKVEDAKKGMQESDYIALTEFTSRVVGVIGEF